MCSADAASGVDTGPRVWETGCPTVRPPAPAGCSHMPRWRPAPSIRPQQVGPDKKLSLKNLEGSGRQNFCRTQRTGLDPSQFPRETFAHKGTRDHPIKSQHSDLDMIFCLRSLPRTRSLPWDPGLCSFCLCCDKQTPGAVPGAGSFLGPELCPIAAWALPVPPSLFLPQPLPTCPIAVSTCLWAPLPRACSWGCPGRPRLKGPGAGGARGARQCRGQRGQKGLGYVPDAVLPSGCEAATLNPCARQTLPWPSPGMPSALCQGSCVRGSLLRDGVWAMPHWVSDTTTLAGDRPPLSRALVGSASGSGQDSSVLRFCCCLHLPG